MKLEKYETSKILDAKESVSSDKSNLEENFDMLNSTSKEKKDIRSIISKDNDLYFRLRKLQQRSNVTHSPYVRNFEFGTRIIDAPIFSELEYDENHDKLETFLRREFIPAKVALKRRKNKNTGEISLFPSIRLSDIIALKLSEAEMEKAIKYLKSQEIRIYGYDAMLDDEFEDYGYYRNFYKDVAKSDVLNKNEMIKKFIEYKKTNDPNIREQIILENIRLVSYVAWQIAYYYEVDVEELEQYGMEALIKCVDNFDPYLGYAFTTYAYPCIRGKILSSVSELKGLKRSQFARSYIKVEKEVEKEFGQKVYENYDLIPIIVDRLIERHYVSEPRRKDITRRIMMLYADGKNYDINLDNIASQRTTQEVIDSNDASFRLKNIMETLNEEEREFIIYKYENSDDVVKSDEECAEHFHISPESVKTIEDIIFVKLRHPYHSKKIKGYTGVTTANSDYLLDNTYDNISNSGNVLSKKYNN